MDSTTIKISDQTRRELLKVAGELQSKRGKRVDYEGVIEYLLVRSRRDERLLMEAMKPTGRSSGQARSALRQGRSEDKQGEKELERRYT
jgi:hypothetical protein